MNDLSAGPTILQQSNGVSNIEQNKHVERSYMFCGEILATILNPLRKSGAIYKYLWNYYIYVICRYKVCALEVSVDLHKEKFYTAFQNCLKFMHG